MGSTKSVPIDESPKGRREMEGSTKKSRKSSPKRDQVSSKRHILPCIELEDNFDMVLQIQVAEARRKQMKNQEKERKKEQLERERMLAGVEQKLRQQ
jgi:hypothetical protein